MEGIKEIRKEIIADPIRNVPPWTVALLDPTKGNLPRRQIDVAGTIKYSEAIAREGTPGVLFAASTGRGHARNFEEHRQTLEVGGQAYLGTTLKQALFRIEDPLEKNQNLMKEVKEWGYAIVWTRRGSNLPPHASDREVADNLLHFAEFAIENEVPFGVYSISTVDGVPLHASAVKLLLEELGQEGAKYLVAIKITEPVFEESTRLYLDDPAFAEKKIVQGWDVFYTRALKAGKRPDGTNQCGATSGAAACMVKAYNAMYNAATENDWDAIDRIQKVVTATFLSMQGADKDAFPDLQIAKRVMGLGHPLTESRSLKEVEKLVITLEKLAENRETLWGVKLIAESLLIMGKNNPYSSPFYDRLEATSNL